MMWPHWSYTYRYLPLNPTMDHPNSQTIRSPTEITLLSLICQCGRSIQKKFYLVLLLGINWEVPVDRCTATHCVKCNKSAEDCGVALLSTPQNIFDNSHFVHVRPSVLSPRPGRPLCHFWFYASTGSASCRWPLKWACSRVWSLRWCSLQCVRRLQAWSAAAPRQFCRTVVWSSSESERPLKYKRPGDKNVKWKMPRVHPGNKKKAIPTVGQVWYLPANKQTHERLSSPVACLCALLCIKQRTLVSVKAGQTQNVFQFFNAVTQIWVCDVVQVGRWLFKKKNKKQTNKQKCANRFGLNDFVYVCGLIILTNLLEWVEKIENINTMTSGALLTENRTKSLFSLCVFFRRRKFVSLTSSYCPKSPQLAAVEHQT